MEATLNGQLKHKTPKNDQIAATKAPAEKKGVIVENHWDKFLDNGLVIIINSTHSYVNPTLKRLAGMCKARHDKLQSAK